ncbi:MAG: hypothetical protein ACO2PM_25360 [Pyrobaculum sp.]
MLTKPLQPFLRFNHIGFGDPENPASLEFEPFLRFWRPSPYAPSTTSRR